MKVNGDDVEPFSGTVAELLVRFDFPQTGVAVAINGAVVPKSEWTTTDVDPDAVIEVLTAAAGG